MIYVFALGLPYLMAVIFVVALFLAKRSGKGLFLLRALLALTIAVAFAHLNRTFNFWQEYRGFPSGHMTFCLGLALSIGMLRPWTLMISLPVLVPFGMSLVYLNFHTKWDVLGAIPLVLIVYGIIQWLWKMPPSLPPLDIEAGSP